MLLLGLLLSRATLSITILVSISKGASTIEVLLLLSLIVSILLVGF